MDLVEVELARVVIHQKGDQQFIHLRERHGSRAFPIVIGFNEVEEINRKLCGVQPPRPLTHDLMGRVFHALGHRLQRVVINELRDSTFYAQLVLAPDDAGTSAPAAAEKCVDCRPSDAIALAVQTGAPMYVARPVFDALASD
jgi:bifunctional DNase/RNase